MLVDLQCLEGPVRMKGMTLERFPLCLRSHNPYRKRAATRRKENRLSYAAPYDMTG
jgi:hypothetical protein